MEGGIGREKEARKGKERETKRQDVNSISNCCNVYNYQLMEAKV